MTREIDRTLSDLETPCLLLDVDRMERNISRLKERLTRLGVDLRPHVKTAKSIEVGRRLLEGTSGGITVSTLKEAEEFAAAGVTDIIYAVGISPLKLRKIGGLREKGIDLKVTLDSVEQAEALADYVTRTGDVIGVMIEIDCDGHRSGVKPADSEKLLAIAVAIRASGAELKGVLTHAGDSYDAPDHAGIIAAAEEERKAVVDAAETIRNAGFPCPIVSVGSSPTAHFAEHLTGVTEVRAGVFVFFDLVMSGIGVCTTDDIAISVLTTVIGHQREKGWIIVDAGWMAMSRDRGTSRQKVDRGYGAVCSEQGELVGGLIVDSANQEHGIIKAGETDDIVGRFPVGTRLRILPNHACATAAQHDKYHLIRNREYAGTWNRFNGW